MRSVSWRWPVRPALLAGGVVVSAAVVELALRGLGFPTRTLEVTASGVPGYALMRSNQVGERAWYAHQPPRGHAVLGQLMFEALVEHRLVPR